MVTGSSSSTHAHGVRTLWRGRVAHLVVPLTLTALLLLASVSPWFLLPLAAAAALTGCMRAGVRRGAFALLLSAACGAGAVIAQVSTLREVLVLAAVGVAAGVFPWTLGAAWRARRESREAAAALEAHREHARQREAEASRAAERTLLAEELHDDLGHVLSLVALNLGRLELDPEVNDAPREAIAHARTQVSEAVTRLGDSVEALRGDESPALLSRHKQADIGQLLADSRAAGAVVEVTGQPPDERLAVFGSQTVFRTVQEGITNAVKHALGQPVTLRFADAGDRLDIAITNPRSRHEGAGVPGAGSGLVALGERVRIAGGQMHVDEGAEVFTLAVSLPRAGDVPPARDGVGVPASGPSTMRDASSQHAGTVRRPRLRAGIAVAAPLTVLVGIAAAITLVDVVEADQAELDPEVFSQIRPGQPRAEAEALLPAEELDVGEDAPPAGDCHRYAITSNPLDDASGDYYRICFTAGTVATAKRVEDGRP